MYFEMIRIGSGYSALMCSGTILLERMLATKRLNFYEQSKSSYVIPFLVIFVWIIGSIAAWMFYYC